jgi:hypothetical protein
VFEIIPNWPPVAVYFAPGLLLTATLLLSVGRPLVGDSQLYGLSVWGPGYGESRQSGGSHGAEHILSSAEELNYGLEETQHEYSMQHAH